VTRLRWDGTTGQLHFETEVLQGVLCADGTRQAITELIYRPAGTRIQRDMLLAVYRLLSRSGWMGEARSMPHVARPVEEGVEVLWAPSLAHHAQLRARFIIQEPGHIDCLLDVLGHTYYPDYEVFLSNYFAPEFRSGGYVHPGRSEASGEPVQILPEAAPVYREMYVAFPRDEQAAHLITDGRWQRGRHFTRFLPARYYAVPLGFYAHRRSALDVLVMGLPRDVFAVSMAYATDDPADTVGRHNSLYLSLFGRDLHPGERWHTVFRLSVGEFNRERAEHLAQYRRFVAVYGHLQATGEVHDLGEVLAFQQGPAG
jgi:hypothetical protein